jgi:hypothetical protein
VVLPWGCDSFPLCVSLRPVVLRLLSSPTLSSAPPSSTTEYALGGVGVAILGAALLVEAICEGLWWLVAWGYAAVRIFVEGTCFPL